MPIKINLLAEAQAIEELRRKDPVKRAVWVGGFLVLLMLVWSSSLQLKAMLANSKLQALQGEIHTRANEFQSLSAQEQQVMNMQHRVEALLNLSTNRLLNGTLLNALQESVVENVELVRLRVEQNYVLAEAIKPKTNGTRLIPGKPATVTEKVLLTLQARDTSPVPGDQVNKYRNSLAGSDYFKSALASNEVKLANLAPPQPGVAGKPFVLFTLECRYPEVVR